MNQTFKDTSPNNFAWASVERALEFSNALANIMVGEDAGLSNANITLENATVDRVRAVLEVVHQYSPIKLATFWALKERSGCGSLLAATTQYERHLSPSDSDEYREFVCGFHESHLGTILSHYAKKQNDSHNKSKGRIFFEDIAILPTQERFIPPQQIAALNLKKALCLPFHISNDENASKKQYPQFLLNLYFSTYEDSNVNDFLPETFIEAVQDKLISGVRALLNRRLVKISESMSDIELAGMNSNARFAMDQALQTVLPKYSLCKQVYRFEVSTEGYLRGATPITLDQNNVPIFTNDGFARLDDRFSDALRELIQSKFVSNKNDRGNDTSIATRDEIRSFLSGTELEDARSMLIGRIHNRAEPNMPRGYIVLVNRLNDYATQCLESAKIVDHFDWQDERVVSHICSILDFIAELFTAEESRFNRAQILGHELQAPTSFIKSTAERLYLAAKGEKNIPPGMQLKEINEIMDTCDIQTLLIHSLMFGFQNRVLPPAELYSPKRLDLNVTAKYVSRLAIPTCQDAFVDPNNIDMRFLPEIYFDSRSAIQIFWNILANAIKYRTPGNRREFSFKAGSENVSIAELEASTSVPSSYLARIKRLNVQRGHLLSFEDWGIGVPVTCVNRIFNPGERADTDEVRAQRGAGIGLAVTRAIVTDHFSDVWVENLSNPTVFCVFLPDLLSSKNYMSLPAWRLRGASTYAN